MQNCYNEHISEICYLETFDKFSVIDPFRGPSNKA